MKHGRILRAAALLEVLGLLIELVALSRFGPSTFVAFTGIGVPLIGLGMLLYLVHVWGVLTETGSL